MSKTLINRDEDLCYTCQYQVPALCFMLGDTKLAMDNTNILSIEIVDDYERNIRQILKVTIRIDIRKKLWIIKNKNKITCKFELDVIGRDPDDEEDVVDPSEVFNAQFGVYLNDDDDATDAEGIEEVIQEQEGEDFKENDLDEDGYYSGENSLDVYLFEKKSMTASSKTFNVVYTKANMATMVAFLLTKTGHKKVLMSPIENTKVYREMLVKNGKAYQGLAYLDQYYGLYKRGALIYYGTDTLYILNLNGKCTAWKKKEWKKTTFLVTSRANTTPGNGMVRKEKEKVYYVNLPEDNISPQKVSISKNAKYGSAAKIIISDSTTVETIKADQSYMNQRNEEIIYSKKDDNRYTSTMIKARMEENECIMYISGDGFDIRAFNPNKEFNIVFEDPTKQKKYGSYYYRIAYAYHYILPEDGDSMKSSHQIILKRCSKKATKKTSK